MQARQGPDLHDLNNPLASVVTSLDLATRDVADALAAHGATALLVGLRDEIRDARRGAERLRRLVRDAVPCEAAEARAAAPPPIAAAPRRGRILVIDDEPMLGRLVHRSLSPEHDVVMV